MHRVYTHPVREVAIFRKLLQTKFALQDGNATLIFGFAARASAVGDAFATTGSDASATAVRAAAVSYTHAAAIFPQHDDP